MNILQLCYVLSDSKQVNVKVFEGSRGEGVQTQSVRGHGVSPASGSSCNPVLAAAGSRNDATSATGDTHSVSILVSKSLFSH